MKKVFLAVLLALTLFLSPTPANVKQPKGFDGKVFQASYGLYATSKLAEIDFPRFICTVTAFEKYQEGFLFVGAGHCTPANADLPPDMEFYVQSDLDTIPLKVKLLTARMAGAEDYAIYYLPTNCGAKGSLCAATKNVETIDLGNESDLRVGDKVVDVNFSLGLAKETSRGVVSTQVATSGDMAGFYGVDMFDSHGASGSSVVDEKTHRIVGLVIAGIDGATMPTWVEPISNVKSALAHLNLDELIRTPQQPKGEGRNRHIPLLK